MRCFLFTSRLCNFAVTNPYLMKAANTGRFSFEYFLEKAGRYCAYSDRCSHDVVQKLKTLGAAPGQVQKVMQHLQEHGFVDDQRFAMGFVRGKLHNNHWGRQRIIMELKHRNIPEATIQQALETISQEDYQAILEKVANKKAAATRDADTFSRNGKIAAYCIQKGFEPDLVWQLIREQFTIKK
jgi:regulatory protein